MILNKLVYCEETPAKYRPIPTKQLYFFLILIVSVSICRAHALVSPCVKMNRTSQFSSKITISIAETPLSRPQRQGVAARATGPALPFTTLANGPSQTSLIHEPPATYTDEPSCNAL